MGVRIPPRAHLKAYFSTIMKIPTEALNVATKLQNAGFKAYFVGGCVRDLLLKRKPKDWDVATDATPEQIQMIFPDSFYENTFGTVGVKVEGEVDETLKVIEVTPFRLESEYSDFRRPDTVTFSKNLEDDLKRRDFTINALALDPVTKDIIDLYKGQDDLKDKIVRTVGDATDRFSEDALRMLRAIRISTELGFSISHETLEAIMLHVKHLDKISKERIRDEFTRIIMSTEPMLGMAMVERLGMLPYIAPELVKAVGVEQNKEAHKYTVFEHLLRSLQHAADKGWGLDIRLASLFHDVCKPHTMRKQGESTTFYGHDIVGARVTHETLTNLRFPVKLVEKVTKLVRWHMFFSDTEQITLSAVRRLIVNVGKENIWDLMNLRACDRIGTGRPKESPYRLRKFHAMIEEAMHDPVSVGMLKIDGKRVMEVTHETPGPKIGFTLHALLEEVIEDPNKNTPEYLESRAEELVKLEINELKRLGEAGKDIKEREEQKVLEEIKGKHGVK